MPFHEPFPLGPFIVAADGSLSCAQDNAVPGFSFRWRGRVMRAAMRPGNTMELRAILGRVPSTASDQVRGRQQSFGLLRALAGNLPDGWRVGLAADHSAVLETTLSLPDSLTATTLLTGITDFLLRLGPYLDLADELGLSAAPRAAA